jgi:putative transposase
MPNYLSFMIVLVAGWVNRHQLKVIEYQQEEIRVYKEQFEGRRIHFTDEQRRRLATKARALDAKVRQQIANIATPDTLMRWFRELVAKKYDGIPFDKLRAFRKGGPGRPRLRDRIADLVVKMAEENLSWGYTRIRDALHNLGITTDRNTVKRILNDHGIEPAPERKRKMRWSTFIAAHLEVLAAMDFFKKGRRLQAVGCRSQNRNGMGNRKGDR